ncbi:hypothetical protein [uncultured Shewanella sp.]|uniref:hypothetical protein n=1 Tax=uncultured Shewanella sp. TaxID=173975 RepID=UPI00262532EE|nr:hypothetical protein [uncultured Shewanella sp.]
MRCVINYALFSVLSDEKDLLPITKKDNTLIFDIHYIHLTDEIKQPVIDILRAKFNHYSFF